MAGNIPAIYLLKLRLFLCTPLRRIRTTGTEAAAGRRIHRARNLSHQHFSMLPADMRICLGNGIHQKLRVGMQRFCIEILLFCNLADIPEEHHADSIRNEIDHGQIMPDEQVGKTVLLL